MPDIFGREPSDYAVVRQMQEAGVWDRHQQGVAARRPQSLPQHHFNALGAGVPAEYQRATEDQQAVGYLTNNMLALQTMVDEIMYTAYRLPSFVHINTNIAEGARSYGVRVRDRVGRAERITGPGYDVPSATASEAIETVPIHWYGLDAEWSIDELRGAMLAGIPLDTEAIDAAVTGTMETMEARALVGGDGSQGLLNQPTTGTNAVSSTDRANTFSGDTAVNIRNTINGEISLIIENSRETLGRNVTNGMTVYLPGTQYDLLTTLYIGDNAEHTLMSSIMRDNPWTHFTGNPIMMERVLELDSALNPGVTNDRMIVALKHEKVAEMGVSIMPRILRVMDKGRVVCAQVEAKFSDLFVKRPNTIRYTNSI